jgi:hypothetical protein
LKYLPLVHNSPGYEYDVRLFIMGMAGVAAGVGQYEDAARLLGTVEAQLESFYKPLDPWDQVEFDWISSEVHLKLNEMTLAAAWEAGRQLTLEQAIAKARQITP